MPSFFCLFVVVILCHWLGFPLWEKYTQKTATRTTAANGSFWRLILNPILTNPTVQHAFISGERSRAQMGAKHSSPCLWLKWSLIAVPLFKWGCSPAWKLSLYFNPSIIADAFRHTPLTLHKIAHFSIWGIETFPAISREQRQPGVSQSPEPTAQYTCKVWEPFCLQHSCPQPCIWLAGNSIAPSQSRCYASE